MKLNLQLLFSCLVSVSLSLPGCRPIPEPQAPVAESEQQQPPIPATPRPDLSGEDMRDEEAKKADRRSHLQHLIGLRSEEARVIYGPLQTEYALLDEAGELTPETADAFRELFEAQQETLAMSQQFFTALNALKPEDRTLDADNPKHREFMAEMHERHQTLAELNSRLAVLNRRVGRANLGDLHDAMFVRHHDLGEMYRELVGAAPLDDDLDHVSEPEPV